MAYIYDLFVSYRRSYVREEEVVETAVGAWVKEVFYSCLCDLWNETRPGGRVFLDEKSIPKGARWPPYLMGALRDSRCLVPIWSPPYFDSRWCNAEWESMRDREDQFHIDRSRGPGLVVPVVLFDGDSFPDSAKDTQHHKFHELSALRASNLGQAEGMKFRERMLAELVPSLVKAISLAPAWDENFPLRDVQAADIERPVPFKGMVP